MQRRVFISHAQNDADWPEAKVEAVAEAIRASGVAVSLDLWHQRDVKRKLSLAEWMHWMDDMLKSATNVLCLDSPQYSALWKRKRGSGHGDGIAFEAVHLIQAFYPQKHQNKSHILTLRPPGLGFESVPLHLALDCPTYGWPADREALLSDLLSSPMPQHDLFNAPLNSDSDLGLSDGLILDGLEYPDVPDGNDSQVDSADGELITAESPTADAAEAVAEYVGQSTNDVALISISPEEEGFSAPVSDESSIDTDLEKPISQQAARAAKPQVGKSGLWPAADEWRAPVGDFPPSWASAWGDDPYGLWADLTVNGATQRMRWIEPSGPEGFWIGSTEQEREFIQDLDVRLWAKNAERKPCKEVISEGFWLADTPCTQAFWEAVTGDNPSHFVTGHEALERPVESVSWHDVMKRFVTCFAQTPSWGTGNRLCLPSEDEWEYAARAGARTSYWWGDDWDVAMGNANVSAQRRWGDEQGTTAVRRYPPNPWGLYDVHGNVWEWCSSSWLVGSSTNEAMANHEIRVMRGGSWFGPPSEARAAFVLGWRRRLADRSRGFRFALRPPTASSK